MQTQVVKTHSKSYLDKHLALIYGEQLLSRVKHTQILIAGVGGIGCELIKSLTQAGFERFTIIDLDIIDRSNLNRQIYLREEHISQNLNKVDAVRSSILKQYPHVQMDTYCDDIKSYGPSFFLRFDIVFCAIDDLASRAYLSQMCTIADKPMIEGGTRSFLGQTKLQKRGVFQCSHCRPSNFTGELVMCSVRAIPTHPFHAVAWAMNLFERLFIKHDNNTIIQSLKRHNKSSQDETNTIHDVCRVVFNQYFEKGVQSYKMEGLSKQQSIYPLTFEEAIANKNEPRDLCSANCLQSQRLWSVSESAEKFIKTAARFITRMLDSPFHKIVFDKHDLDCVTFVCSATNLRIYNFLNPNDKAAKLKYISLFDVQERIGNITPTIASTNSIIAGLQVTEVLKYLQESYQELRAIWVLNKRIERLDYNLMKKPTIDCRICSYLNVYIHLNIRFETTLGQFLNFIISYYSIVQPQILFLKKIIYDSNDDDEDMAQIYKRNLGLKFLQLLGDKQNSSSKSIDVISPVPNSSNFYFYFLVKEDLTKEIVPDVRSSRSKVIEQQKIYLQQILQIKRDRMTNLSCKYYFLD